MLKKKPAQKKEETRVPKTLEDMVQRIGLLQEKINDYLQSLIEVFSVMSATLERIEVKISRLDEKLDRAISSAK